MSVNMTHACDRCGKKHEQDPTRATGSLIPMRIVAISVGPVWHDRYQYMKPSLRHEATWCLECVGQYNLDGLILAPETQEKKFTLEDYIKEIVTHAMKEAE